jgi:glycosyltransferase involved in cell wall biosynthesis
MKALHVIPAVAETYGGPSYAVLAMGAALEARGIATLVATTDANGAERLVVPCGRPVPYQGTRVVFFPRQWSEAFKYSGALARWLASRVGEFDVVHVHGVFSHACLAAGRACRRTGIPYVVRPLGSLDPWSLSQKPLRKRLLWHAAGARLLQGAAAVHYTTAAEQRLAESTMRLTRGVVIPLGVGDDVLAAETSVSLGTFRRRYPELERAPYVLSLSRLHPKKGLEALVQAFGAVTSHRALDGWRLVIAGDGDASYVAQLRRVVERVASPGRVLLTGWLTGTARLAAYRDAALFALPSWQENFSLSVAEALACGLPAVISERVNLADEIVEAGAGWVVPLAPDALEIALRRAMEDGEARAERGRSAWVLARRRFTWPAVAAELESLYRTLLGSTQGPRSESRGSVRAAAHVSGVRTEHDG